MQVQFLSERLRHALLKYGNEEQVGWLPEIEEYGMEWADVYFGLRGAHNLYESADVPAETLTINQRAMGRISTSRWEKTRWVLVRVPNDSLAQQAHTDVETLVDMFFASSLLNWEEAANEWRRIASVLEQGDKLRLLGTQTDLSFSVKGRTWLVGDGRISVPDGEIYTAPVETTLNGTVHYEFPAVLGGRIMDGIQLTWKQGKLVEATAGTNQDYLRQIVATDSGSGLIGEFGFGVNPAWTLLTTDILLDEKIGGTIHTALGRPYPECGGTYHSAIHWDIVKDTRTASEIYLDGQVVFKEWKFSHLDRRCVGWRVVTRHRAECARSVPEGWLSVLTRKMTLGANGVGGASLWFVPVAGVVSLATGKGSMDRAGIAASWPCTSKTGPASAIASTDSTSMPVSMSSFSAFDRHMSPELPSSGESETRRDGRKAFAMGRCLALASATFTTRTVFSLQTNSAALPSVDCGAVLARGP